MITNVFSAKDTMSKITFQYKYSAYCGIGTYYSEIQMRLQTETTVAIAIPVTVAMLDPIAKDCEVAPAASEALINSWRYSRASAYSLRTHTHTINGYFAPQIVKIKHTYKKLFFKIKFNSAFIILIAFFVCWRLYEK